MIIRIVKMVFQEEKIADFQQLFEERKDSIRAFDGCNHVELWRAVNNSNVFFTYSIWDSGQHLDRYRLSAFFKDTWSKTKALFAEKPQAWSVERENAS